MHDVVKDEQTEDDKTDAWRVTELDKNVAEARDFYKMGLSSDGVINMIDDEQKLKDKEDMYKQKRQNIREAQGTIAYNRDKTKAGRNGVCAGLLEGRQENANRSTSISTRKEQTKRPLEEERLAQIDKYREDYEARTS